MVDDGGTLGIIASALIGGFVGVATQFVCGVVDNMMSGKTGIEIFTGTGTVGEYVTAFATGALCSIPGANTLVSIACDIAMPAIQQGIDCAISGTNWDTQKYVEDVATNFVCDIAVSKVSVDSPKLIRDIKAEAKAAGYKGTRQLNSYLNRAQNLAYAGNQILSSLTSLASTVYKKAGSLILSAIKGIF